MDGLNTALPFGVRKIDALRTLTTESLAVFIPFRVQEIYHKDGVYYGQNVISKNMIIANRRHLLNGNSFILGVSGAGKSFTAKEEMTNIILTDPNADVIIIDPEREYSPLVKAMQGEVVHISATSENHINAMDMNSDYGDGANPVILKSEFILSLWQTSGTVKVCHLAFNLWNGYAEEGRERFFTPEELFCCEFAPYFMEGIKVRYPEYCRELPTPKQQTDNVR